MKCIQEVWKVSTTAGTRRGRKSSSGAEAGTSTSYSLKDFDASERLSSTTATSSLLGPSQSSTVLDTSQVSLPCVTFFMSGLNYI